VTIKRISRKSLKKAVSRGKVKAKEAAGPPPGISPMLRASWKFASKMAEKFSREMVKDRTDKLLKTLARKFK